jgi:hypothetical protein
VVLFLVSILSSQAFESPAVMGSDFGEADINTFFNSRRVQLVHLATLHKVPATYAQRQYAEVG